MVRRAFPAILLCTALFSLAVAACSGDDAAGPKTNPANGADAAYVTGLCKAISSFTTDFEKAAPAPPTGNASANIGADLGAALLKVFDALTEPFRRFSESFAGLKPPADLADWHKSTSQQLATAAKALKDKKYDDPSLQGLSQSPLPDIPAGPRERLAAIAANTSDCKQYNPFDKRTADASSNEPTPALKEAANGTWKGKFGTIAFNADGTASLEIRNCGYSSAATAPFGVEDTCAPDTYSGTLGVGSYAYTFRRTSEGTTFAAYVDREKQLHIGAGTVSPFGPGRKGTVKLFAGGLLNVDGDNCSYQRSANRKETKQVTCAWKKEQGQDVLEYETEFGSKDQFIILPAEGLAVSPNVFVGLFKK